MNPSCTALGRTLASMSRRVILPGPAVSVCEATPGTLRNFQLYAVQKDRCTEPSPVQGHWVVGSWSTQSGEFCTRRDVQNVTGGGPANLLYWTCFQQQVGSLNFQRILPPTCSCDSDESVACLIYCFQ